MQRRRAAHVTRDPDRFGGAPAARVEFPRASRVERRLDRFAYGTRPEMSASHDLFSRFRLRRMPWLLRALLAVALVPLLEYALLVWISDTIGFLLTLLLLLAAGAVGAWCVRSQGLDAWGRLLDRVRQGEPVGEAIFDGVLILFAGLLLITPGFLTDVFGFALLVPRVRNRVKERMSKWLRRRAMMQVEAFHADGRFTVHGEVAAADDGTAPRGPAAPPPKIIDVEPAEVERR